MNKPIVRCRCGHQVLSKEVLRTDLYERRAPGDASRDYVYVKYRCRHCKRMGETFVAESRWDWAMLEAEPNEMTEQERDRFLDEEVVTPEDVLDFHCQLETFSLSDLAAMTLDVTSKTEETQEVAVAETAPDSEDAPIAEKLSSSPEGRVMPKTETPIVRTPRPPDEPRNEPNESRHKHT